MPPEVIVGLIGLAGVLIATGVGFLQWWRSHRLDKQRLARDLEHDQPEPAELDAGARQAEEYRRALIAELRQFKILDMTKSLDLEKLYVQVQVREEEPRRYVRDEETDRKPSPGRYWPGSLSRSAWARRTSGCSGSW